MTESIKQKIHKEDGIQSELAKRKEILKRILEIRAQLLVEILKGNPGNTPHIETDGPPYNYIVTEPHEAYANNRYTAIQTDSPFSDEELAKKLTEEYPNGIEGVKFSEQELAMLTGKIRYRVFSVPKGTEKLITWKVPKIELDSPDCVYSPI